MNVQAMSVTTIARANVNNPEIVVVPHVSFADALDHARMLNAQLVAEGRISSWKIIGFRTIDGKETTFWAAESRPTPVVIKSPVQQLIGDLTIEFEGWDVVMEPKKNDVLVIVVGDSTLRIRFDKVQNTWRIVMVSETFKMILKPEQLVSKLTIAQWMDKACCL